MTVAKKKNPTHDDVQKELGQALTGLFTVLRHGYESTFASAKARRERVHADVEQTRHNIDRGAGVEGEPFRL